MEEGERITMKHARTDAELDSLLARGGLGPARRDAILEAVLAVVSAEHPPRSRWRWAVATVVAAGAAAAVVSLVPRTPPKASLRAKGGAAKPSLTTPST